ncbi:MAG: hypothetical protein K2N98_07030, partial [Lachnospiraceae bacterium]|nr:hypothetical protein [Lachnospiraceae bacterium]
RTENFPGIVERVKFFKIKEEGVTFMCEIADRIRREGKEEGREEGRSLGRLEIKTADILELLEDFGQIPQRILLRIRQETDMELLGKWHKCAARASSIAEFESKM